MTGEPGESVTEGVSPSGVPTASPQDVPTDGKQKRIDLKLPATLRPLLEKLRESEESDAAVVKRILESVPTLRGAIADLVSTNEHLQKVNTEIRETLETEQVLHQGKFDKHVYEIGQLRARITTLESDVNMAVVPAGGQGAMDSVGMKDVLDDVKEVCGDDETCGKMMGKMLDMKAHFASKASDQEHNAEQNRLDREQKELDRGQKELDRKSKEVQAEKERNFRAEQAEKDQNHRIELALAKKGGFKEEFLDDVVFLGGGSPKRPGKEIERRKQQARAAAEDEEEFFDPDAEETLMMPDDDDGFGIPAGLPRG